MPAPLRNAHTIAVLVKWLHVTFFTILLSLIVVLVMPSESILVVPMIVVLAFYVCLVLLQFALWNSWVTQIFVLLLALSLVGVVMGLVAYTEALSKLWTAGYHMGWFGPKEITLFGKKKLLK